MPNVGLSVGLLGPVALHLDGQTLSHAGVKRGGLVALLAARPGMIVSGEAILDNLWPQEQPKDPKASVHVLVSSLRKLVGTDAVATTANGYTLALDRQACDVWRFTTLAEQARGAFTRGDNRVCIRLCQNALAEWRGEALQDLSSLPFAAEWLAALATQRMDVVELRAQAMLGAGEHAQVAQELEPILTAHPFREGLWAAQMTALYRCGQQSAALATYEQLRRNLDEELGVDPSTAVRDLHLAILRQDPALSLAPPAGDVETTVEPSGLPPAVLLDAVGLRYPLHGVSVRIGRHPENTIVLDGPKVSRRHAVVVAHSQGYMLTDLDSRNGTRVNGQPVHAHLLASGDIVAIGDHELVFQLVRD